MNRIYRIRIISVFLVLCLIISGLPPFTIVANAEDADDKTSIEIAEGWGGFDTSRPERSWNVKPSGGKSNGGASHRIL